MIKPKVLFFIPHPDDLEFGASLACIEALKAGMDVIEVLMTNGEYGTKHIDFRGDRLRNIRMKELTKSAEMYHKYTNNQLRIIKMGFVDGHLNFNSPTLTKVIKVLFREKPDIIFAPDPFFPMNFHPDHLNTGRLTFFALKKLNKKNLPKHVFFYYSFKKNRAIKCAFNNNLIQFLVLSQHRSQIDPVRCKLLYGYRRLVSLVKVLNYRGCAVKYRELLMDNDLNAQNNVKILKEKVKYALYRKWTSGALKLSSYYFPTPKELGLI